MSLGRNDTINSRAYNHDLEIYYRTNAIIIHSVDRFWSAYNNKKTRAQIEGQIKMLQYIRLLHFGSVGRCVFHVSQLNGPTSFSFIRSIKESCGCVWHRSAVALSTIL